MQKIRAIGACIIVVWLSNAVLRMLMVERERERSVYILCRLKSAALTGGGGCFECERRRNAQERFINLSRAKSTWHPRLRSRTLHFIAPLIDMAFANMLNTQTNALGCLHASPATALQPRSATQCHRRPIKSLRVHAVAETETRAPATSNGSTPKV